MQERTSLEDALNGSGKVERELEDDIGMIELGEAENDQGVVAEAEAVPNIRTTAGKAITAMILLQNRLSFCDDVVIYIRTFVLGGLVPRFNVALSALVLVHIGHHGPLFGFHELGDC